MMSDGVIERLNLWGGHCARIAWPLLWQSSLLIVGLFIADIFLRRKIRPSVRQALWFVVLVKLLLPPSFAIPTGIAWWLRPREVAPAKPQPASYIVTYGSFHAPRSSRPDEAPSSFVPVLPSVRLSASASALLASAAISAAFLIVMLVRWRHLQRQLSRSESPPIWLQEIVGDARSRARCRRPVRLSLTDATISPALCGLFRPVILLPSALVKKLTPPQLRAVLLHELFHLRNGDVWINCFQSLLQIVFWWHPFLWFANARIRRIREEVVDDSVRLALAEEAETYAPTLLEVARLALARPLATLGLVGILESRHALKQRVDRLVNFPAPRRVGLSVISVFAILAFASAALPMGQAPPKTTPVPLFTRVIRVDPNAFAQGLESVVGFSIGNFRTGGQGGGGQQRNSSEVAVPRVQVAPNGIGGQGGAQGGAGGISGVTRPITMTNQEAVRQQVVRQFFASAGVDFSPPKSVFFNYKQGQLLAHATLDDFDIIEKALVALNAGSVIASTSTAPPTTASVAETSSKPALPKTNLAKVPLGDLPVVGKALTRTIEVSAAMSPQQIPNANNSSGGKLNTENMTVDPNTFSEWVRKTAGLADNVSPQETMDAFRKILLKRGLRLALPANILYNGRDGNLLVRASRPEMDVIEKTVQELNRSSAAAAERLNQPANDKLLTRTIKLDLNNFFAGIQREANLTGQPSLNELQAAFGKLLNDAGVRPVPPEVIRFDDRNGTLFVQATSENMEAIESKVLTLSIPPAQISIKAKFVEIAKGDTQHFLSLLEDIRLRHPAIGVAGSATTTGWDPTNALVEVITEEQFRDLLRAIEKRDGTDLLTEAGVTTLSGRQAQIQIADMKTILTKVNPQALVPPGVNSSNVFTTENVSLGPALDVISVVADDGMTVSLDVTATIMGFVGYGGSAEAEDVQVYLDGNPQSTKPPLPHFRVRQMHTAATVTDGQTLLLGNPRDAMLSYDKDGKGSAEPGAEKKDLLVFATITIVDPAGNPIHNPAGTSAPPGRN